MSEPQTITTDHVRALLDAGSGATIGLIEGRVEVIDAEQLGTEDFAGALEIVSHDELAGRLGDEPGDHELAEQADQLTMAARTLGG
jgi:hypothetical protein